MKYIDLTDIEQQEIVRRVQAETGLNQQIIEKDWWVTAVLRALFSCLTLIIYLSKEEPI